MTDSTTQLVRALADSMGDPPDKQLPLATEDATEAIKAQLTTNTGTHILDSGGAFGRHWEENQENPPWDRPEWDVGRGYVTHNVYHYMDRVFGRDRACVALEAALYAYSYSDDRKRDAWLQCQEGFGESLLEGNVTAPSLRSLGLPEAFTEDVLGIQADLQPDRTDRYGHSRSSGPDGPFTYNTYNGEWHGLSQVLQGTNLGGPYADYVFLQVHQGADVRGGYTGPRVYSTFDGWITGELSYYCERCEWSDMESCLYDSEELVYQRSIDPFELEEEGLIEDEDDGFPDLDMAHDADHIDGAVFHKCDDGQIGHVVF